MKSTFKIGPRPEDVTDAIPLVLTPTERGFASWITVHLEKVRRMNNKRDAKRGAK